jgi:hypothetical protein
MTYSISSTKFFSLEKWSVSLYLCLFMCAQALFVPTYMFSEFNFTLSWCIIKTRRRSDRCSEVSCKIVMPISTEVIVLCRPQRLSPCSFFGSESLGRRLNKHGCYFGHCPSSWIFRASLQSKEKVKNALYGSHICQSSWSFLCDLVSAHISLDRYS